MNINKKLEGLSYLTIQARAARCANLLLMLDIQEASVYVPDKAKNDIIFGDLKPHPDWVRDAIDIQNASVNTDRPHPHAPGFWNWPTL